MNYLCTCSASIQEIGVALSELETVKKQAKVYQVRNTLMEGFTQKIWNVNFFQKGGGGGQPQSLYLIKSILWRNNKKSKIDLKKLAFWGGGEGVAMAEHNP